MATHLRSSTRPEAKREGAALLVWTECGIETPAGDVDNENGDCRDCLLAAARREIAQLDEAATATVAAGDAGLAVQLSRQLEALAEHVTRLGVPTVDPEMALQIADVAGALLVGLQGPGGLMEQLLDELESAVADGSAADQCARIYAILARYGRTV